MPGAVAGATPWPPGWTVRLLPGTHRPRPHLLVGGSPLRVLRLAAAGVAVVDRLVGGAAPTTAAEGRLARQLTDAGIAVPVPAHLPVRLSSLAPGHLPTALPVEGPSPVTAHRPGPAPPTAWSVVVPVRDRPVGLAATLAAIAASTGPHPPEVVVVDDASDDPAATAAATAAAGLGRARVVRRARRGGPAAARNTGWRTAAGDVVVFVDADVTPVAGWADALIAQFADGALGAVGPRVVSVAPPGPKVRTRYEAVRSPLDLGPTPSPVRPGARVAYLPSATLAVRREALEEVGGFDEAMPVGEDVDLVWRLVAAGWAVRYDPSAQVGHPPRGSWAGWATQRFGYGTSAAPLAVRHAGAVAPVRWAWSSCGPWALALVAGWVPGAITAAAAVGISARAIAARTGLSARDAAAVAAWGHVGAGRGLGEAVRRPWWPVTMLIVATGPRRGHWRRRLALLAVAPLLAEWWGAGRPLDPGRWVALRLADDVAYGAGLWAGVAHTGAVSALLPARSGRPRR